MFGAFRNPTVHAAKVSWQVREDDALDLLVLRSPARGAGARSGSTQVARAAGDIKRSRE